ncbi:hypothetical protein [Pararobbsia silviterrae]|uniref:hypothetical protein n=1 Tax=Pararobbsia silviterrae TaxID=1792498 RepID=UPI0011C353A1|nr:hypothetical protein [Pararobbsia silviterrae]
MLSTLPDFLSVSQMLKATPATEGDARFVYLEASNQTRDLQGEVLLAKALEESASYYLKFGNLDLEHFTQIGAKQGIPMYESYEIGKPVDVRVDGTRTFVKGQIYTGTGPAAEKANLFWSSLTQIDPPKDWYPSVGGGVLGKSIAIDPETQQPYPVITKVRWSNVGFSRTPVNPDLETVSTMPIGVLTKCWGAAGIDLRKSLTAGYSTDSASMTGGEALRIQSLQGGKSKSYRDFRDELAGAFMKGEIAACDKTSLVREAGARFGLSDADAALYVGRFLDDLKREN